ncbi:hypothetical protein SAMN04489716_5499 [Actinoplanes derwentensis]|uniref:DUF4870 domain-containing protein n=2 Tax=Actinoplanes derwentensis TaxID=113562 RepID=A0A1H2CAV6_9ACTN|nr:hypothetical protein SAMN04489716_5499 [Actinoplanes derwentensis]
MIESTERAQILGATSVSTGWDPGPSVYFMTEPPRPPDDDPTAPYHPQGGYPPPPPPPYTPPPPYADPYGQPQYGKQPYDQPQYGPPQYGSPYQAGSPDERTWVLIAHFGGAAAAFFGGVFIGWLPPLVAYLARGNQSPIVRAESLKALNFQLVWTIVGVVGYALIACAGLGLLFTAAAWVIATLFGVIAGIKAVNNEPYQYPMTYPFIK